MTARTVALKTLKVVSALSEPMLGGRRRGPRILIYHQVGAGSGLEMDLDLDDFEAQLDWMAEHGEIVDIDTALARRGEPDSDRLYVLTFDDGHVSLFGRAFPLLRERGVPFTLYVTTAPLESDHLLHGDNKMTLSSWDDLQQMYQSGLMTVGAHGHRHLDTRDHASEVLREDLEQCNQLLWKRLGIRPFHFAYPWGHRSDEAEASVREFYRSAVIGSHPAGIDLGTDVHRLPRIPVMQSDSPPWLFARKMWGGFRLETSLRSLRDRLQSP